ncbi:Uncharacterised protein [uncultured archaeon]|nr:Uncharacterised protein [uncultured archaeon]
MCLAPRNVVNLHAEAVLKLVAAALLSGDFHRVIREVEHEVLHEKERFEAQKREESRAQVACFLAEKVKRGFCVSVQYPVHPCLEVPVALDKNRLFRVWLIVVLEHLHRHERVHEHVLVEVLEELLAGEELVVLWLAVRLGVEHYCFHLADERVVLGNDRAFLLVQLDHHLLLVAHGLPRAGKLRGHPQVRIDALRRGEPEPAGRAVHDEPRSLITRSAAHAVAIAI